MAHVTIDAPPAGDGSTPEPPATPRRRRLLWRVLIVVGVVLVLLVGAAAAWWVFGRDRAHQVSDEEVLDRLRDSGATGSQVEGLPQVGVYSAVASGTESLGIPGLDESFGPNAPVTVTHGDAGCFTYRADLNSHHYRTWTFCPTGTATFALAGADSATVRNIPGLEIDDLTTYSCDEPLPYLWPSMAVGERREGSCTGTSDTIDGVTRDAGAVEVLDVGTTTVGGTEIPVVHVRSTDTFTDAQTGTEVDEWWLHADTGLPVKVVIDADLNSSAGDYTERGTLELTSLVPRT